MLEAILLRVMLEKLSADNLQSVITTFTNYQAEVEWDLTMKCNYSCTYCESYNNSDPTQLRSLEEYINAISYLKEYFQNKTARIDILGGEPTLFKHWDIFLNEIDKAGFIPKITTNLSMNNKTLSKKVATLKPKNCIDVSWHPQFAVEETIINNIKTIYNSGHLRSISIAGDKRYWNKVIRAYESVKYTNKCEVCFLKDESSGKTVVAEAIINYSKSEKEYIQNSLQADIPTFETVITKTDGKTYTINSVIDFLSNNINNFKGLKCEIGFDRLHIKPNGDVYPSACLLNYPKARLGNIYKENLHKPKNPIKCPFTFCGCGPDLRINKYA